MVDGLCFSDIDPFGRELDDPLEELSQDIVHMLLESYRSNEDALARSIGLEDALSDVNAPGLRERIESKLTDDERVTAAEATLSDAGANGVRIDLRIVANETVLNISLNFDGNGNVVRVAA
jgi:hypothetical protein